MSPTADNVAITPGSGKTVLADEVVDGTLGTGVSQYVKVMDGTIDSTNKWLINTDGSASFVGNVASGAADSGNPVKVGGKYNATPPTLTDGNRGDIQLDSHGTQKAVIVDSNGAVLTVGAASGDGLPSGVTGVGVLGLTHVFNGTAWDRLRGTTSGLQAIHANATAATGSWTSATAQDTTVSVSTVGFSTVLLSLVQTSPITDGQVTFEADDGSTTWFQVYGIRQSVNPNLTEGSYSLQGGQSHVWRFDVGGFANLRIRLSRTVAGSGTTSVRLVASSAPNDAASQNLRTVTVTPNNPATVGQAERQQIVTLADSEGNTVDASAGALHVTSEEVTMLLQAILTRLDYLNTAVDKSYTPADTLGLY